MLQRIRVGILFGGKSAEHEVSLQSAKNIIAAIDPVKYEVILIGIDKSGVWRAIQHKQFLLNTYSSKETLLEKISDFPIALIPESHGKILNLTTNTIYAFVDVIFPILHGTFGEDGTAQGLLELADIPFVGSGVLGSAVGMDKDVMKRLLRDANVPVSKFLVCQRNTVLEYEEIVRTLGTPIFVKPANAGSSIGVSKVHTKEEYETALRDAFLYDRKIIIEENVRGREIECAVLGNENPITSIPGEVIPHHDFYSYEAKYLDSDGASIEIPAKISSENIAKIQAIAIQTFQTLCCEGLGRVDVFLTDTGEVFVNEINTLPGFTSISMYPKLFEASGIPYTDLIDRLIMLALERYEHKNCLKTSYS